MRSGTRVVWLLMVVTVAALSARAENWPGFEGGNLHHNASAVTVAPTNLTVLWDRTLGPPREAGGDIPAFYGSRNLALRSNRLAIVGVPDGRGYTGMRAYVTILDATNGAVRNCIQTTQYHGPHGVGEAHDTATGITVANWDPDTGILFLANGGDGANHTAYLPLANAATYGGPGTYQVGVGAYESLYTNHPAHQDQAGLTRDDKWTPTFGNTYGYLRPDNWDYCNGPDTYFFSNQSGFFDVDASGDAIVANFDSSHDMAGGVAVINKFTGARAWFNNGSVGDASMLIEPPVYPEPRPEYIKAFKMFGGSLVGNGRIFHFCPGLYLIGNDISWLNQRPDGGYTGPGAAETARIDVERFRYRWTFDTGEGWGGALDGSYNEFDNFYRNKAWLIDGTGCWAAWKPGRTTDVEIAHATDTGLTRYRLGVGQGLRGQDLWPHISLTTVDTNTYIVYYAGNAWVHRWDSPQYGTNPLGNASLAVFNATTGGVAYTYTLNNPSQTGAHPTLPPNEGIGFFDRSQLVVAGRYAYIAWVDVTGTTSANAILRVLGFDVAATSAPTPREFTYDLGVPAAGNRRSCVFDLIAANGTLYALVTLSDTLAYDFYGGTNETWTAQRVVALTSGASSPGELAFSSATSAVPENVTGGTLPVTVMRRGGVAGAVSVQVNSSNGTATADADYGAITNLTLAWADGDGGSRTFEVPIVYDALPEIGETFTLALSGATGGAALGLPSAATVTILNSPPPGALRRTLNPVADTWVDGDAGNARQDVNFGSDDFMHVYGQSDELIPVGAVSDMLLRFDLGALPGNATITNATLRLFWLNNGQGTATNRGTTVYVLGALKPWTEGDGTAGSGATLLTYDGTNAWEGGRINASDANYDGAFSAYRARQPDEYWAGTYVEFDVTALVDAWHRGSRPNHGCVVVNNGRIPNPDFQHMLNQLPSEYNVASREGANKPELVVDCVLPPLPTGAVLMVR